MGCKEWKLFDKQCKKLNKRLILLEIILSILRRMTFTDRMLSFNKKTTTKKMRKKISLIIH